MREFDGSTLLLLAADCTWSALIELERRVVSIILSLALEDALTSLEESLGF